MASVTDLEQNVPAMEASDPDRKVYQFAGFTLDLGSGTLSAGEAEIALRPKSFEVLRYLVEHAGLLATKDEMLQAVWGHHHVSDGSLAQCIIDIRKALGDSGQTLVRNIPRRGYVLHAAVTVREQDGAMPPDTHGGGAPSGQTRPVRPGRNRRLVRVMTVTALLLLIVAGIELFLANGSSSSPHRSEAAAMAHDNSIAVLPFLDLSANSDQAWFAEGLSEEILNSLSQYPDLRVIARTSSFSFKDSKLDIPAIGSRLGVAYVLEGSVRKAKQTVRITAQLVSAGDGTHLWSQTYDRQLENILQLQSEIAAAVADALEVQLVEKAPAAKVEPVAYEAFLQAEFFYNRRMQGDIQRAGDYYRRAVAIDPGFARAWVGASGADGILITSGIDNRKEVYDRELAAARKGVELDPGNAVAHMRLAQAYYNRGQREMADTQWSEAIALDSNDPFILSVRAGIAYEYLNFEEALRLQRRAAATDPVSYVKHGNLATFLFSAGHYEEALAEYGRTIALNPSSREHLQTYMVQALVQLGRYQEALDLADSVTEPAWRDQLRAMALVRLGRVQRAEDALQALRSTSGPLKIVLLAQYYAWSGNAQQAFSLMDQCLRQCEDQYLSDGTMPMLLELASSPLLGDLRNDPRWPGWYEKFMAVTSVPGPEQDTAGQRGDPSPRGAD